MAERKAVNKYYPPDWDPRKQGSANKRVGQHPLRDRAKKLSQGILVIRFELPYNIWCGGCGSHVGMGVRYNAEKSKVGNYYSTPIYKFRMKCHLCDNYFEIQTDPKNHDYVILNGARRKEQRWDPVANGQVVPEDKATQKKLATDAMYKLEHGSDDHQKGRDKVMNLAQIEDNRMSMKDDYILNRMARDKFRSEKKQLREAAEADRAILEKASLDIELVEESEDDRKLAGLMKYSVTSSFEEKQNERRKSIEQRPIFDTLEKASSSSNSSSSSSSSSATSPSSTPSNVMPYQRHAPVKLSRRGELKQKLGWALKSSYKDPFKAVKKKGGGGFLNALSSGPSCLGIKLVSPKSSSASSSCKGEKQKQNDNSSNMLDSENKSELNGTAYPNSVASLSEKSTEDCFTNDSGSSQRSESSQGHTSSNTAISESLSESSSPSVELAHSSHSVSETKPYSGALQPDETARSLPTDTISITEGTADNSQIISSPPTGLASLMCSYTDSDSETSS